MIRMVKIMNVFVIYYLLDREYNRPGEVLIETDYHTVTSGAFGTFAIGVENTDAAFILAIGELLLRVSETIKLIFHGKLSPNIMSKDLILLFLQLINDFYIKLITNRASCSIQTRVPYLVLFI